MFIPFIRRSFRRLCFPYRHRDVQPPRNYPTWLTIDELETRLAPAGLLVTGAAEGDVPTVRVLDAETGAELAEFSAFDGTMTGGVRVALGDVNGDGVLDIIAGAGSGQGQVRVFDGQTFQPLAGPLGDLQAFGPGYQGGVYVASGDINRDGHADVIVGADGSGAFAESITVRIFNGADGQLLHEFAAPVGSGLHFSPTGGVRLAVADFDRDARADIVTATGDGIIQQIAVISFADGTPNVLGQQSIQLPSAGAIVHIAASDATGDFYPDILISQPGKVRVFQFSQTQNWREEFSFDVSGSTSQSSPIAAVDINNDERSEFVTSTPLDQIHLLHGKTRQLLVSFPADSGNAQTGVFVAGSGRETINPLTLTAATEFNVLERLGQYDPATKTFNPVLAPLPPNTSFPGKNIYFISHGWAPGWRKTVDAYAKEHPGDFLKWWQTTDPNLPDYPGEPASDWLFLSTQGEDFQVSPVGLAEAITSVDPNAVVIAYSWIDESATDSELEAYESEVYTLLNGLRLGNAAQILLGSPDVFKNSGAKVHILGHSHGAKVATVGALTLQKAGYHVEHLTTLDSADSTGTISSDEVDATNFVWFYMQQMTINKDPSMNNATFVDNYNSYFGNDFSNFPGLGQVVDVDLYPRYVFAYDTSYPGNAHGYAVTWYTGGSIVDNGMGGYNLGDVALGWSPLLKPGTSNGLSSYYQQDFSFFDHSADKQFILNSASLSGSQVPAFTDIELTDVTWTGTASYDNSIITLANPTANQSSSLTGTFTAESGIQGISFDFQFTGAGEGDQLVISIDDTQYFVMIGSVAGSSKHSGTLSVYDLTSNSTHNITFALNNPNGSNASIAISDLQQFRIIDVPSPVDFTIPSANESSLTLVRQHDHLQLINDTTGELIFEDQLGRIESLTITGRPFQSDQLTIDFGPGGYFELPGGITFTGGTFGNDALIVKGTPNADNIQVQTSAVLAGNLAINMPGVEQVLIQPGDGHDSTGIFADGLATVPGSANELRRVSVDDSSGDDTVALNTQNLTIGISDAEGTDTVDFSQMASRVQVYLYNTGGQFTTIGTSRVSLGLTGTIENAIGTAFDDLIFGNSANNHLLGGGGNDYLLGGGGNDILVGEAGNDNLIGQEGDDLLLGGEGRDYLLGGLGNDVLSGGADDDQLNGDAGRDLLLGGAGRDTLTAGFDEDLLVGGSTSHDQDEIALQALLAEWSSARTYEERLANLKGTGGGAAFEARLNGRVFLVAAGPDATVLDDGIEDWFFSHSGRDAYFARLTGAGRDRLFDLAVDEVVEEI